MTRKESKLKIVDLLGALAPDKATEAKVKKAASKSVEKERKVVPKSVKTERKVAPKSAGQEPKPLEDKPRRVPALRGGKKAFLWIQAYVGNDGCQSPYFEKMTEIRPDKLKEFEPLIRAVKANKDREHNWDREPSFVYEKYPKIKESIIAEFDAYVPNGGTVWPGGVEFISGIRIIIGAAETITF
jgi:hypothetical protein